MAKLQVFETGNGNSVPFLRGILTRSLQDLGLSFHDAYELASVVRKELGDDGDDGELSTSTGDIRECVLKHLAKGYGREIAERYGNPHGNPPELSVVCSEGHASAFSRSKALLVTLGG